MNANDRRSDSEERQDLRLYQAELEMQNEELRAIQMELERSRDEFVELYNDAPVGYLTLDSDAVVRRVNHTFVEMLGDPPKSCIGRSVAELILPEDRGAFIGRFRSFFADAAGKASEVRFLVHPSGSLWCRITARRVEDQLLLAVTDVSAQKAAEETVRKLLETKEMLLRELQHRVKNTMHTISGLLALQIQRESDATVVRALNAAQGRIQAMVLMYEALHNTGGHLNIDLERYAFELSNNLRRAAQTPGIEITCAVAPIRVPTSLAITIGMIINEAVTNSLKHAFPTAKIGTIAITLDHFENGGFAIVVRDNGIGMNAQSADSHSYSSGLGLSLIQGLADHSGITLTTSSDATGTTVRADFPPQVVTPPGHPSYKNGTIQVPEGW